MMRALPSATIAAALIVPAAPAAAWTRPGHMVSAAIVYQDLMTTDPEVVREILRIIEAHPDRGPFEVRSEEHTSELQSLMRISYAVFCLKKKTKSIITTTVNHDKRKNLIRRITSS